MKTIKVRVVKPFDFERLLVETEESYYWLDEYKKLYKHLGVGTL
jgi:hypothetical protein